MRSRSRLRRLGVLATLGATLATAVTVAPQGASANEHPGVTTASGSASGTPGLSRMDAHSAAMMAAQVPLLSAVDRIQGLAHDTATAGLAGVSIDAETNSVTVHWHGAVPGPVNAEIAKDRAAGIKVSVLSAAYTWTQLDGEIRRLSALSSAAANRNHTPPPLLSVGARDDYSGLDVGVSSSAMPMDASTFASSQSPANPFTSSFPVSTHAAEPVIPAARQNDFAPFYGGAEIRSTSGEACSTGFGVHGGGKSYILTAAHCGWDDWVGFTSDVTPSVYGRTSGITYTYDAQIIPVSSAGSSVYLDDSITNATNNNSHAVTSTQPTAQGTWLCTDGAFSGERCNIQVRSANRVATQIYDKSTGQWRYPLVWQAQSNVGDMIAGTGDSGGPVLAANFVALGTITAIGNDGGWCNGVSEGTSVWYGRQISGRFCSDTIFFPSIRDELPALGVTLP